MNFIDNVNIGIRVVFFLLQFENIIAKFFSCKYPRKKNLCPNL